VEKKDKIRQVILAFGIGLILISIDLLIKFIANSGLEYNILKDTFLPFLKLYLTHNEGYHYIFGRIPNNRLWSIGGLIFITIILGFMVRSLIKDNLSKWDRMFYLTLITLVVGATGNVWEIIFTGKATDYFIFKPFPWPSNLCDQYINAIQFIMLPLFIIRTLVLQRRKPPKSPMKIEK